MSKTQTKPKKGKPKADAEKSISELITELRDALTGAKDYFTKDYKDRQRSELASNWRLVWFSEMETVSMLTERLIFNFELFDKKGTRSIVSRLRFCYNRLVKTLEGVEDEPLKLVQARKDAEQFLECLDTTRDYFAETLDGELPGQVVIDFNQFNRKEAGSLTLLQDLIADRSRNGVPADENKYGKSQPKALRTLLRDHGLNNIADKVTLMKNRIKLQITFEKITTK